MTVHMAVQGGNEADQVAAGLAIASGRHFGGRAGIEGLARESGGASRQTWSFDALVDGCRHELILRRDPPSASKGERERSAALDRATEFRVLRAAWQAGERAPEVLFELTPEDGLGDAYVIRPIPAPPIPRKLLRAPPHAA